MRSRGLHASIIFQNIAQLKNRYPNDAWQEIIGNCDSRLFLGATDVMTSQFVADLLGKSTVRTINTRKKAGLEGMFDFGDISYGTSQRNLLNADEILRLPPEKAILSLRGQKPLMLDKMDYTKHPLARKLIPQQATEKEWACGIRIASSEIPEPEPVDKGVEDKFW
jgi:type IV secretion system protein VirD4